MQGRKREDEYMALTREGMATLPKKGAKIMSPVRRTPMVSSCTEDLDERDRPLLQHSAEVIA